MSESKEIFKGKSVEDLYKEIYSNSKSTKSKVNDLIKVMTDKVENTADAIRIMPLIKDYLDVGVKNDEHLIKLAQIIQRSESKNSVSDQDIYGDLQSLLDNVNQSPELPAPNQ
jgi:predicted RecB family endonuclease